MIKTNFKPQYWMTPQERQVAWANLGSWLDWARHAPVNEIPPYKKEKKALKQHFRNFFMLSVQGIKQFIP